MPNNSITIDFGSINEIVEYVPNKSSYFVINVRLNYVLKFTDRLSGVV